MQDFERREFEAILLLALDIVSSAVSSPIAGCNRSSGSRRGGGIGNLGVFQEIGDLRGSRHGVHGKRRLGLVDLVRVVFHRKLSGDLSAPVLATRQQSCLGGIERTLVILVIALGEFDFAIGPRRVGLTRVELRRGLALVGMATRQQRGLGALGLHGLGHVDKRIIVLVVIVQNRVRIIAHDRGHGHIGALLTKNAQVRTGDAGNRQGLFIAPRARIDIGTTTLGKIGSAIARRAQNATHRKADDDKANDGQTQQDHHRDRFTQGILQRTRNKRTDVAARGGQVLRHKHEVARIARARHHQRKNGDDGDKDNGATRDRANVERRVLTQKERGGKQQNDDRQHVGAQAKAKMVETGNHCRHGCRCRRNHGNERRNRQNGNNHAGDIAVGRRLDQGLNIVELGLVALIGTKMGTGTLSRCRLVVGFIAFGVLCRSARQTKPP